MRAQPDPDQSDMTAILAGGHWLPVRDGDPRAYALFRRHYTARPYRRRRRGNGTLFAGPGEKMVLLTARCDALFVWRKFIDKGGQTGVNCAVFRNESPILSSMLIEEACRLAWRRWPGARLYTYVNPRRIRSVNPGCCFLKAGWRRLEEKTAGGLVILERLYG